MVGLLVGLSVGKLVGEAARVSAEKFVSKAKNLFVGPLCELGAELVRSSIGLFGGLLKDIHDI